MSSGYLERDCRRLRIVMILSSGALLVALVVVGLHGFNRPWRAVQRQFTAVDAKTVSPFTGIRQYTACTGAVDRCPTCHSGMARRDLSRADIPLPYRSHGPGIGTHRPEKVGCTACHGGQGRVLDKDGSHAHPDGTGQDPLMTQPHIQASCARCHVPGEKAGQERLVEGAAVYAALGCPVCHPLVDGGKGGWDFGPDLTAIRRKTLDAYRTSLLDPTANFAGSTMPSFRLALENEAKAMESLLIYLESLPLPKVETCGNRQRSLGLIQAPCADCHAGASGRAGGRMIHRCPYLLNRKEELRCGQCHRETVPRTETYGGYCPFITRHRDACSICHADLREEGGKP
jgi:hypothetical protein